jgi:hypothetical protein
VSVEAATGEIVPVPVVRPDLLSAAPVADAVALQKTFHELSAALLDKSDYQRIGGKEYKTKSAWRKLAAAFNVSDEIVEKNYDRDPETGRIIRAEFTVRATAPNGRSTVGVGLASIFERHFNNPEHDLPATAHTRAKSRAFSDLFGLGEVSAEEMYESSVTSGQGRRGRTGPPNRVNPPSPRRRDTGDEGQSNASGEAKAEDLGLSKGVAELEARLLDLDPADRNRFKDWRKATGMEWPPGSLRDFAAMVSEVRRIEEDAALDADTYDG